MTPRSERVASAEHAHGGDPERDLTRFGLASRPVVDFSVNLSPLGPPKEVRELWSELWPLVESYPSLDGAGVRDFYAERFGLTADQVLPGNGATELIYLVPRALELSRVTFLPPAYDDYQRASRLAGAEVVPIPSPEDPIATPDVERLERGLTNADALFIGQPNNPTGSLVDAALLRDLADAFPNKWLLVDESFIQFTDDFPQSSLAFSDRSVSDKPLPENVLVFHSLTKFYALAGLRLGAVIGRPTTIERLRRFKEPWTVNAVANRVAQELAACRSYEHQVRRLVHEERSRLEHRLAALDGIEPQPASANFLLARWTRSPLDELLRALLEQGICVRDASNFPGLEDGWIRLAVRCAEDNDRLLDCLTRLTREADR